MRALGKSASLRTPTGIRFSVQFFRVGQPTSSFNIWACVVLPSVMQHAVLLGRDIWMRFNTRSYSSFPSRPSDQKVFGALTPSHHAPTGAAFVPDPLASGGRSHVRHDACATSPWETNEVHLIPIDVTVVYTTVYT